MCLVEEPRQLNILLISAYLLTFVKLWVAGQNHRYKHKYYPYF